MFGTRPYTRRLIVVVVVVASLAAFAAAVPGRPRTTTVPLPPGSIFDSHATPYEYYDEISHQWLEYTYVERPVYQAKADFMTSWSAGMTGCYVLSPADEWAAVPDLRAQVVDLMARFEKRTYSYDPDVLANLPTFSATCRSGDPMLLIQLDSLGETFLGVTEAYGTQVTLARNGAADDPNAIHWCPSGHHEDGTCYQIGAILMHELGHVLGLAHSSPGVGPSPALTIMSIEGSDWDSEVSDQFGLCDMAGLQARYGLAGPDSRLSPCLPPMGTKVTLSREGDRLAATLAIDPSTIPPQSTEVVWLAGETGYPTVGHWETNGFVGQFVHRQAAVELWQRSTGGGSVAESLVGAMTYVASPAPKWTIDLPAGGPGVTYFARFVGDGTLLADDSEPLSV